VREARRFRFYLEQLISDWFPENFSTFGADVHGIFG